MIAYNQSMSDVEFLGEKDTTRRLQNLGTSRERGDTPLVRLVMKTGLVRTKAGANAVLITLLLMALIFTGLRISRIFENNKVSPLPPASLIRS